MISGMKDDVAVEMGDAGGVGARQGAGETAGVVGMTMRTWKKKAAANALELLNRWPEPRPPENWVAAMTAVARDEVEHLAVVTRLLARRGGKLTKSHSNPYANALHQLVRKGRGTEELVDRLLISSLIEARSCERFKLLGEACEDDVELRKLYRGLWASEHCWALSVISSARGGTAGEGGRRQTVERNAGCRGGDHPRAAGRGADAQRIFSLIVVQR